MHHSSPSFLPNQKSLWIQECNKTHSLWLHSLISHLHVLLHQLTSHLSLGHGLIADLISHLGCSLCVMICESQRFIFILSNSVVAHLIFTNLSTNLQIFPENRVYTQACMCVYVHTFVLFCNTRKGGDFFSQA